MEKVPTMNAVFLMERRTRDDITCGWKTRWVEFQGDRKQVSLLDKKYLYSIFSEILSNSVRYYNLKHGRHSILLKFIGGECATA